MNSISKKSQGQKFKGRKVRMAKNPSDRKLQYKKSPKQIFESKKSQGKKLQLAKTPKTQKFPKKSQREKDFLRVKKSK